MSDRITLTPALCVAARGLLRWTAADLSEASGVSLATLHAFEKEKSPTSGRKLMRLNNNAVVDAFEEAGVVVFDGNRAGGPGVRYKDVPS